MREFFSVYKEKVLKKYFFTYLLIFLIPFFILSISLYQFSAGTYNKRIEDSNLNHLTQLSSYLDDEFESYKNIASSIRVNQKLSSFFLNHPYYNLDAKLELNKYTLNTKFLKELFIYYPHSKQFHSQNGNYDINTIIDYKFDMVDMDKTEFKEKLIRPTSNTNIDRFLYPKSNTLLTMFIPISNIETAHSATVVFFMESNKIIDVLSDLNQDSAGDVFLYTQEGEFIASTSDKFEEKDLANIFKYSNKNKHIKDKKYVISKQDLVHADLSLITVVDHQALYSPFFKVQVIFFVTMIVLFVIGLALSMFLSYNQYKPIQHLNTLFDKIAKKEEGDSEESAENILETLNHQASHLIKTNHAYNKTIQEQQLQLKSYLLRQLLEGKLDNATIDDYLAKNILTDMNGYFSVGLIEISDKDPNLNIKVKSILIDSFPIENKNVYIEAVELPFKKEFIAIILQFTDAKMNECDIENETYEIIKQIDEFVQYPNTYYFGTIYDGWSQISKSYIEAIACRDYYAYRYDKRNIYLYKDLPFENHGNDLYNIDSSLLMQLQSALTDGNDSVSAELIESLLTSEDAQALPPYLLKPFYFRILNTLLETANDENICINHRYIEQIVEADNLLDIIEAMKKLANEICQKVKSNEDIEVIKMQKNILNYIKENFRSHDFSLEDLALEFDFSVSYLSKLIKDETGQTFSKHVQELRLEYIKKQLVETDDMIKNIIYDAGYYDVSNFTRKFRTIVGVTPGQYRTMNQKKE
ncbi:MAG TPA: helix-turn-helix domain-containing protein [Erysipelothrix sp.]